MLPFYYYGFDWTYLTLVLPCLIFAMIASSSGDSNRVFRKVLFFTSPPAFSAMR